MKTFKNGARIFLKKVPDPERFGVPALDKKMQIIGIQEKPKNPRSEYAVTGLYMYDKTVFNKIRSLKPSRRGELEVTDLNNLYLKEKSLSWAELDGYWSDAGIFDSMLEVGIYWKSKK